MIDFGKIREGDEVAVRGKVLRIEPNYVRVDFSDGKSNNGWCRPDHVVSHTSAPREIAVGDSVTWDTGYRNYEVLAISGQRAWLSRREDGWTSDRVLPISWLRHAD